MLSTGTLVALVIAAVVLWEFNAPPVVWGLVAFVGLLVFGVPVLYAAGGGVLAWLVARHL